MHSIFHYLKILEAVEQTNKKMTESYKSESFKDEQKMSRARNLIFKWA